MERFEKVYWRTKIGMTKNNKKSLIYEQYYILFRTLNFKKNKTIVESLWHKYALLYCLLYEVKRSIKSRIIAEIEDKKSQKRLKKFYATHKPPYSNEDKCFIISNTIASRKGRKLLSEAMLNPIGK
jgi:hypothetical protein